MFTSDALRFLSTLIVFLSATLAHAQSTWKGDMISLRGTTIPSACWPGQIRKNTADDKVKLCAPAGTFDEFTLNAATQTLSAKTLTSPTINSATLTGTLSGGTFTSTTLTSPTVNTPTVDVPLFDDQASSPSNPSAGFYKLYFKSNGNLYKLNSSGTETQVDAGGTQSPYFNYLVNPEFRHFQITTPGTLTTIGDGSYCADQWYMIDSNGGSTSQCARADASGTAVGGQYTSYWANFRQSNGTAKQIGVCQPLEYLRSVNLRGKAVDFAFYAKTDSTEITTLRVCIGEWTGTANTITKDVVSSWGATPTWIANFACANTPSDQTISSSWSQIDTTATLGTSVNNVIVCVWTPNTEAQNDDFYMSQAQLTEGSAALAWKLVQKTYEEEQEEIFRFYQKSFPVDTPPAQNTGTTGANYTRFGGTNNLSMAWSLRTIMRSTPSVTTYNPSAANSSARNVDAGSDVGFVDQIHTPWALHWAFNSGAVGIYRWHWSADARL